MRPLSSRRKIAGWFCFVLALVGFPSSVLATTSVVLATDTETMSLGSSLSYFEDPEGSLTIDDVSKLEVADRFTPAEVDVPNFGFTDSTYWFYLRLDTRQVPNTSWLIECSYPLLDFFDLYYRDGDGNWAMIRSGDQIPFRERSFAHRNLIFETLVSGDRTDFYFRVRTESSLQLPLTLWSPVAFAKAVGPELYGMGLYYGIMLALIFYNLFLFISTGGKTYFYYVLYVASYALFQMALSGLSFELLWPEQVWWANKSVPFFIGCIGVCACVFAQRFLNTATKSPRSHGIMTFIILSSMAVIILSLVAPYKIAIKCATVLAIAWVISMLVASIASLRAGYRPARYFLLAFVILLLGCFIYALKTFGLLPSTLLTNYALQVGSAIEVILLSLGLGARLNELVNQRVGAEEKARLLQTKLNVELRSKLHIFSKIAHELNNPLNYVVSGVSAIETKHNELEAVFETLFAGAKDNPAAKPVIDELQRNLEAQSRACTNLNVGASKVAEVVREMRGVTDIDGKVVFKISMREILDGAIRRVRDNLGEESFNAVELISSLDEELGDGESNSHEVVGNLYWMVHALECVIENSFKFASIQREPKVELSFRDNDTRCVIEVAHNGEIQENSIETLFELDDARSEDAGLAVAHYILGQQGGEVLLTESGVEGEWVRFEVHFPCDYPAEGSVV